LSNHRCIDKAPVRSIEFQRNDDVKIANVPPPVLDVKIANVPPPVLDVKIANIPPPVLI